MTDADTTAILSVIRRITAAWRDGPVDEIVARIAPCLDPNVVVCGADLRPVARGAATVAASYEGFVRTATVQAFTELEPEITVASGAATAVCPWTMTYTLHGETYTESGHDLLVLSRADGAWRVMWRAMLPSTTN